MAIAKNGNTVITKVLIGLLMLAAAWLLGNFDASAQETKSDVADIATLTFDQEARLQVLEKSISTIEGDIKSIKLSLEKRER